MGQGEERVVGGWREIHHRGPGQEKALGEGKWLGGMSTEDAGELWGSGFVPRAPGHLPVLVHTLAPGRPVLCILLNMGWGKFSHQE